MKTEKFKRKAGWIYCYQVICFLHFLTNDSSLDHSLINEFDELSVVLRKLIYRILRMVYKQCRLNSINFS